MPRPSCRTWSGIHDFYGEASKRSLFEKSPAKTFVLNARELEPAKLTSRGCRTKSGMTRRGQSPQEQKVFAELFSKSDRLLSLASL
jgi:hypothetical protein